MGSSTRTFRWRLVVLGVAQDGGVPHMGCDRGPCGAARRGHRRTERVACIGITNGAKAFLIDATPDFPAQVHALDTTVPDGVLLTHAHVGHYTGLFHLGKEVAGARGVPVHATQRMREFLSANAPWSTLVRDGCIDLADNARVDLGGVVVRSLRVPHRDEHSDTVGYLVEGPKRRILYVPDIDRWDQWAQDVNEQVAAVDAALLDGTFYSAEELPGRDMTKVPHPLVVDTMDRLADLGPKVWFTHLNHTNPLLDDVSLAERRGFHVAREGNVFAL
jgi:pyrroloquinoline quinone biosynthesis protein B